jgi:hypothetical protein
VGLNGCASTLRQGLNNSVSLQGHLSVVGLHRSRDHVLRLAELLLLFDLGDHLVHGVVWPELVLLRVLHQILHEEDGFRYLALVSSGGRTAGTLKQAHLPQGIA